MPSGSSPSLFTSSAIQTVDSKTFQSTLDSEVLDSLLTCERVFVFSPYFKNRLLRIFLYAFESFEVFRSHTSHPEIRARESSQLGF